MTYTKQLREKAMEWITSWNTGDFKSLMDHYADDVVFYSSAVSRRWNSDSGMLTGKNALENHFRKAFEEIPGMKLGFRYLLSGTDGVLLVYQRETGRIAADLVLFNDEGRVKEVRVFNEE
jgi:hypothetical protein